VSWLTDHSVTIRKFDPRTWIAAARGSMAGPTPREQWEELYAEEADPYGYERAEHRDRYEWTLCALDGRRFGRGLEVGCSVGVFTQMLAPRCDDLVAVDISERAVERARDRLGAAPGVRIERRSLPDELPAGPFDLIVCSDVLCYLRRAGVLKSLRRMESALAPGGILLAVHWRPVAPTHTLSGDRVHRLLVRRTTLRRTASDVRRKHRLDRFEKP
jgi:SAM-dependent methyltransferase